MTFNHRLLAAAITFLLLTLACFSFSAPESPPEATATAPRSGAGPVQPADLESAAVAAVIDGDTIELSDGRRVRYIGLNTPERNQLYYQEATEINRRLVEGKRVYLEFDQDTFDRYGRTLAYIWVDGVLANRELIARGFANTFTIPPNVRYEDLFLQAEQQARQAGQGLWAGSEVDLKISHIEADAPGDDRENPNGEWIEISNQSDEPVRMDGYTLTDAANHTYTFADFTISPAASFRLHSGRGGDTAEALYWGLEGESVWNNGGDTAFLRDAEGALVDTFSY